MNQYMLPLVAAQLTLPATAGGEEPLVATRAAVMPLAQATKQGEVCLTNGVPFTGCVIDTWGGVAEGWHPDGRKAFAPVYQADTPISDRRFASAGSNKT